jgi:hypothetical protein
VSGERDAGGVSLREAVLFMGLLLVLAWLFGTFTRFVFDDEATTLGGFETYAPIEMFHVILDGGYDVRPPLFDVVYDALWRLGLGIAWLRLVSLGLTGGAFLLVLDLALRASPRDAAARAATMALFVTFPLLYGMGDAIRWYPLFAVLVALFVWLDARMGRPGIRAGLVLGLAGCTNYLAIMPYLAWALRRYGVERRFSLAEDGRFHAAILLAVWPGLWCFGRAALTTAAGEPSEYLDRVSLLQGLRGLGQAALGFFGGYRLGVVHAAVLLPYLALLAMSSTMLMRQDARGGERTGAETTLLWVTPVLAIQCALYSLLTGYGQGRAYLFLAPFAVAILALGYWRSPFARWSPLPLVAAGFLAFAGALANAHSSDDPFKRDLVLDYAEIEAFVRDNTTGSVLVAGNNGTADYLMRKAGLCVVTYLDDAPPPCLRGGAAAFDYVVVLENGTLPVGPVMTDVADGAAARRHLVVRASFGRDRWAALKSRLSGRRIPPWIADVAIYH